MKGKKLYIYICFTVLIILLSFVIYYGFSEVEKTNMQNISFSFIILAEVIFFSMIYFSTNEKNSIFQNAGLISSSSIYIIITLIVNIFLKVIFPTTRILCTVNIIMLLIYIGIIMLIFLVKEER